MHAKLLSGGQDDATHNRLGTAGLEGTGGTGRPGCGAGGRRRSLADNESTYHHTKHLRRRRSGGHRRDRKAWPRCRWAAAGPGRASPSDTSAARLDAAAEPGQASRHGPGRGAGGRRRGLAGLRGAAPNEVRSPSLAGGPPPTGTHSGQAHQGRPRGGRGSGGATSTAGNQVVPQAPAGKVRTPRSTPGSGRPGGRRGARAR